jgi:hypothetical protein
MQKRSGTFENEQIRSTRNSAALQSIFDFQLA